MSLIQTFSVLAKQHRLKVSVAESCTGGLLASALTSLSGSSSWFDRGFVTYSNKAKVEMLGVSQSLLDEHGAVSQKVAESMAIGALERSQAMISVAITGIAGPLGGSLEKPVGTVWFGFALKNGMVQSELQQFLCLTRFKIRKAACQLALTRLCQLVENFY